MGSRPRILASIFIIVLGIPVACGKSEGGDDDGGAEGPPDWSVCELNSDCVLSAPGCCDVCGEPTLGDVDAVNGELEGEHFADVCPEPVPCPRCATQRNPDLHATCSDGECLALDIRRHAASECASNDECRLRVTGCCECGGSTTTWDLIAINRANEALYSELVCDPEQGCDDCVPSYPSEVEAFCAPEGHCEVRPVSQ